MTSQWARDRLGILEGPHTLLCINAKGTIILLLLEGKSTCLCFANC